MVPSAHDRPLAAKTTALRSSDSRFPSNTNPLRTSDGNSIPSFSAFAKAARALPVYCAVISLRCATNLNTPRTASPILSCGSRSG